VADSDVVHADVAGWVLGALDPDESERFEAHLETCDECQKEVADLGPAAQMLKAVLPDVELATGPEPPADLQVRTMARIEQVSRKSRWRRGNVRVLASAAAVVAVAAAGIGFTLAQSAPTMADAISLHHEAGETGSGQVVMRQAADGWSIQLNVSHLQRLPSGQYYECVWVGPGGQTISAGSFAVDASGSASVQLSSDANPDNLPTVQIVIRQADRPLQPGTAVLTGKYSD
jgi:predicted anti-sigma-YlaC factor YlaD